VFPYRLLIRINHSDTILIASSSTIELTDQITQISQSLVDGHGGIKSDLIEYFGSSDAAGILLKHVVLGESELSELTDRYDSRPINTDLGMRLEYTAPLRLFADGGHEESCDEALLSAVRIDWFRKVFHSLGCSSNHVEQLGEVAYVFHEKGMQQVARQIIEFGLSVVEDAPRLLAMDQLWGSDREMLDRNIERITSESTSEAVYLGVAMWKAGEYDKAILIFERLLAKHPNSATTWTNLGINCESAGQMSKAKKAFEKAVHLDPFNDFAVETRDTFLKRVDLTGNKDEWRSSSAPN
jgi:tetratricopeptide (TPR) repeat protein